MTAEHLLALALQLGRAKDAEVDGKPPGLEIPSQGEECRLCQVDRRRGHRRSRGS